MDTALLEAIAQGRRLSPTEWVDVCGASEDEGAQIQEARLAAFEEGVFQDIAIKRAASKLPDRHVEHVATTERPVGQFKDVVLQSAWDFDGFMRAGAPLMWAHDGSIPVLGSVREMRKAKVAGEKVVVALSEFMTEGKHAFADLIWEMVRDDWIRGVSVGFRITDTKKLSNEEKSDKGIGEWGFLITGAELIELSVTQIPADKGAVKLRQMEDRVMRAVHDGVVDTTLLQSLAAKLPDLRELEARLGQPSQDEEVTERVVARGDLPRAVEQRLNALEANIARFAETLDAMREQLGVSTASTTSGLQSRGDEGDETPTEGELAFCTDLPALPEVQDVIGDIFPTE